MRELREVIIEYYLDRINNYLSHEKFAEHNGLTKEQTVQFLQLADKIFNSKHPEE